MTAHARTTGTTLTLLPLGVAAAMQALDPTVFAPMISTAPGRVLLGIAGAMELSGWYVIRWMIRRVEA
jgi:Flp pilus assembly protein TadB